MSNENNRASNKNLDNMVDQIGEIDDEIIESALGVTSIKPAVPWKKLMSVAACFVLVVIGVVAAMNLPFFHDGKVVGDESGTHTSSRKEASEDEDFFTHPNVSESDGLNENSIQAEETPTYSADDFKADQMDSYVPSVEGGLSSDNDILFPPMNTESESSIIEQVEIDSLDKLAYYSGWLLLRENNEKKSYSLNSSFGIDVSVDDVSIPLVGDPIADEWTFPPEDVCLPPEDVCLPPEDVWTLIPIDPDYDGEIYAYAIYQITVCNVKYFKMEVTSQMDFLAENVGVGECDVMVLKVEIEGVGVEFMLVVKNGDRFYSCLSSGYERYENGIETFYFSASKYVSYFSIVKQPDLEKYFFELNLSDYASEILFKTSEGAYATANPSTFAKIDEMDPQVFTAMGLDEKMYKIYLEEVAAGIIEPEMPNIPTTPVDGTPLLVESPDIFVFEGVGSFAEHNGFYSFTKTTEEYETLKSLFANDEMFQMIESFPQDSSFTAVYLKGRARTSHHKLTAMDGGFLLQMDYVQFDNTAETYTVFLLPYALKSVELYETEYSNATVATFSTNNDLDTGETEMVINLSNDATYFLYENGILVYESEYKISEGMICLVVPNDTLYIELQPNATFTLNNRIFKLV